MKMIAHLTKRLGLSSAAVLSALVLTAPGQAQITKFQHIVFVIQENRTPDNFFQGLCNPPYGTAASCSTTPSATQYDIQTSNWLNKMSKTGVTQPIQSSIITTFDMDHTHSSFVALCDFNTKTGLCRMDGQQSAHCDPNCPMTLAQYESVDYTTGLLNPYLTMATQYGWANYMFQTNQGPSFAAHHFIFGGTSAPTTADDAAGIFAAENAQPSQAASGCIASATTTVSIINSLGVEFENIYPCLEHQTLADLLLSNGLTWQYYSSGPGWIGNAPTGIDHICGSSGPGGKCKGTEWTTSEDENPADVLTTIGSCELRSVTWVTPSTANSDHARGTDGGGPAWVASIVNAIGNATTCDGTGYWKDTAIVVTWDDWGGWYDHEPPPVPAAPQSGYQYGARVPMLFISAYTPVGYIDNTKFYDFGSFLRFAEHNFGIPEGALDFADARQTTDLTKFYNLNQSPRSFQTIPADKDAKFFLNDKRQGGDPDDK